LHWSGVLVGDFELARVSQIWLDCLDIRIKAFAPKWVVGEKYGFRYMLFDVVGADDKFDW
jgi:hypothetical protein